MCVLGGVPVCVHARARACRHACHAYARRRLLCLPLTLCSTPSFSLIAQVNQRLSAERLQQLLGIERAQREALSAEVEMLRAALKDGSSAGEPYTRQTCLQLVDISRVKMRGHSHSVDRA